jgi:hypothetical protein
MKKLFVFILWFLIAGCAMNYTIPVVNEPVVDVSFVVKKLPIKVGVVIPNENYTLTKTMPDFAGTETTLTVPFGKLIKQSSLDILPSVFQSIEIVKGEPYPTDIEVLFITTVEDFNKEPERGGKPSVVNVSLKSQMIDLTGMPIWSKKVSVQEKEDTPYLWSYEANAKFWGGLISKATSNALKETCKEISSSREVRIFASTKGKSELAAIVPPRDISPAVKSDIDEPPLLKVQKNQSAYAVVIGIEDYRQKLPKADFALQDARLVTDYLIKAMGYPEENVVTLLNDHASNVDLAKYFEKWLANNIDKDSTVFVYYSGHGAPNPKTGDAYLVPYDGDPSFIDQTGYSLKRMYDALGKLPAKEIIVALDSCFSGAGGRSVLAEGARPLVMNLQGSFELSKNMTVMAAASGNQISSTYKDKGHGLFTYFMLKGIKNEDVVNTDGSIDMDDLFGYLKPQVERIARKQYNNEQSPQLIVSDNP